MSLDELFRDGSLKRIPPSEERAKKSVSVAERYLSEAKQILAIKTYDLVIMASYSSVFHAARAVLFMDGIGERSHFAIYQYLKETHGELGDDLLHAFDMYRKLRHSVAYGLDSKVGKDDAERIVEFAEEFVERVRERLDLKRTGGEVGPPLRGPDDT